MYIQTVVMFLDRVQRKWTLKEIEYLETNRNLSDCEISEFLGRSLHSIRGKRRLLGHKKHKIDLTIRKCKMCSTVIGNYHTRKKYCTECSRLARLETYKRYDIKRRKKA